jgi:hypothetical protein
MLTGELNHAIVLVAHHLQNLTKFTSSPSLQVEQRKLPLEQDLLGPGTTGNDLLKHAS